jgi:hypothetical protein
MNTPTYYVVVFGNPEPPEKARVESGRYHLGIRGTNIPGENGDILLPYCTGSYSEHFMSVPGIGIVISKDNDSIFYRYLPLSKPISKDRIDQSFTAEDRDKFSNIRFDSFWMFAISPESFRKCVGDIPIDWP